MVVSLLLKAALCLFTLCDVCQSQQVARTIEWEEQLGICRHASSCKHAVAKTATDCKKNCVEDAKCVMVKFHAKKKKCWLCDSRKLIRHSKKCPVKYDFYIKDIDECTMPNKTCSPHATCTNTHGNYTCHCNKGYHGNGQICEDLNECESKDNCGYHAKCMNTIGSYDCACKDGFHGDGYVCNDVDECTKGNHACDQHCTNTVGSYKCSCKHGYVARGTACEDINECTKSHNLCGEKASCINQPGSYRCDCNKGFQLEEEKCVDIDECTERKHTCKKNFKCVNTHGSHKCVCKGKGFLLKGKRCKDVNECKEWKNACGHNFKCINNQGSYRCLCKEGFRLENNSCEDVNECADLEKSACGENAECINKLGSYKCLCKLGFHKENDVCKVVKTSPRLNTARMLEDGKADVIEENTTLATQGRQAASAEHHILTSTQPPTLLIGHYTKMASTKSRMQSATEEAVIQDTEQLIVSSKEQFTTPSVAPDTMMSTEELIQSSMELPTLQSTEPSMTEYSEPSSLEYTEETTMGYTQETTTFETTEYLETTAFPVVTTQKFVSNVEWIARRGACLSVGFYEVINVVSSAGECMRRCEEHGSLCGMVQYDEKYRKCWLHQYKKMKIPKKCTSRRIDYYVKGIDECDGQKKCHQDAVCASSKGHKVCVCIYGFKGDGWKCEDIDECSTYKDLCAKEARCTNTIGSYSCTCKRGYTGNGRMCQRKDSSRGSKRPSLNVGALIKEWKAEHSGTLSTRVIDVWTFTIAFLLSFAFPRLLS